MHGLRANFTAIRLALLFVLLFLLQNANTTPIIPVATPVPYSALPACAAGISPVVSLDSASTRTATGDCSVYLADLITQRKPNMRVRVAKGVTVC
eukprot:2206321-Pleurochrysis_carterae.AAC.2